MGLSAVPSAHPNYIGMVGMHGNVAPNRLTQKCDVLLSVGMRFSDRVTGDLNTYAPEAKIIHVDIDASELGRIVNPAVAICGDAKAVLQQMNRWIKPSERREWFDFAAENYRQEFESIIDSDIHPTKEKLTMGEVVELVAKKTASGCYRRYRWTPAADGGGPLFRNT